MYKVTVQNPCSCFIKNGFVENQDFETKEQAQQEAESLMNTMSKSFCKKHEFSMVERFGDYTIYIKPRN
jgi:hypothetical protein